MTLTRPNLIKFLVPLFVFAATLLSVKLIDGSQDSAGAPAGSMSGGFADGRTTDARIASLQTAARGGSAGSATYAALGDAYLQKARETFDPSYYARAESRRCARRWPSSRPARWRSR